MRPERVRHLGDRDGAEHLRPALVVGRADIETIGQPRTILVGVSFTSDGERDLIGFRFAWNHDEELACIFVRGEQD